MQEDFRRATERRVTEDVIAKATPVSRTRIVTPYTGKTRREPGQTPRRMGF
jgi:hypothetical protein